MKESLQKGYRLFDEGRYQEVLDFFKDSNYLNHPEIAYYQALSWAKLGRVNNALEALDVVIDRGPHFVTVVHSRMIRAFLLTGEQRFIEAKKDLSQMIDDGVESSQIFSHYGYVLWAIGLAREGIAWLNRALKLNPDNSTALNSLAYFLAEEEILLDKALRLCLKALSFKKDHPNYLDTLGWIHYKMNNFQPARLYLEKALLAQPENRIFRQHLDEVKKGELAFAKVPGEVFS